MDIGVISVRYARALLRSAMDSAQEDRVYDEMQTVSKSYIAVPELRQTIDNPMILKSEKKALLITSAGGDPCKLTRSFFDITLKRDRENMILFMANSYITLYRNQKNIIRGKLITATPVKANIESKMKSLVESKTNGSVEFETEVDPNIIGGFILEYDTYRMDASVKNKLNSVLATLKK